MFFGFGPCQKSCLWIFCVFCYLDKSKRMMDTSKFQPNGFTMVQKIIHWISTTSTGFPQRPNFNPMDLPWPKKSSTGFPQRPQDFHNTFLDLDRSKKSSTGFPQHLLGFGPVQKFIHWISTTSTGFPQHLFGFNFDPQDFHNPFLDLILIHRISTSGLRAYPTDF